MKIEKENGKVILTQQPIQKETETTPLVPKELQARLVNKQEEEYAEAFTEAVITRQQEINETLAQLTPEEQIVAKTELAKEYGLTYEEAERLEAQATDNPTLPIGDIIQTVGMNVISEMLARVNLSFDLAGMVARKQVRNGLHRVFYRDFWKIDHLKAYDQKDYQFDPIHNPKQGIIVDEIWPARENRHIGFSMYSPALNDITRDFALFIALLNEIEWNMVKPMAVDFYRLSLRLIITNVNYHQFPVDKSDGTMNGYNWANLPVDIEIKGENDYDALIKLKSAILSLGQPSRNNVPERVRPKGLTQNQMLQLDLSNYYIFADNNWRNYIDVMMKSGRFNEKYLNVIPKIFSLDFNKAFGEFNGDTSIKTAYNDCMIFLVPKPTNNGGLWIINHYSGMRSQPNLNLLDVAHFWTRDGVVAHRTTPVINIKFTSAKAGDGISGGGGTTPTLKTINSESLIGSGDIKLQKPVSIVSGDLAWTNEQLGLDPNVKTTITNKQDKTDNALTTTSKQVVGAINEVNAKK